MKTNPVGWFEIYVQDMGRARKFYESVFQIKLEKLNNPDLELWGFPMLMDRAGATGALVKMEGLIPVAIAHLSTLAALIVPLKSLVSLSLAEAFNVQRRQLVSMVLFHWLLIPKETCLACIQCNE